MNIVIVDDHPIVQKGLKLLLEAEKGWRVVGQAADGAAAARCIAELKPDVAIVDLNLPDTNGLDVVVDSRRLSPETRIIILSMHMNDYYMKAARRKGASAYVSKHVAEQEIVKAVKAVSAGRTYPEQFGSGCLDDTGTQSPVTTIDVLTTRELEVLRMLARGCQNKDVAMRLDISVRTAEKHRGNIMRKLNLKNHAELVHYALQNDLVDLPKQTLISSPLIREGKSE